MLLGAFPKSLLLVMRVGFLLSVISNFTSVSQFLFERGFSAVSKVKCLPQEVFPISSLQNDPLLQNVSIKTVVHLQNNEVLQCIVYNSLSIQY